ncbi:C45 family autoproteolytic acyltransferase/hydolase [Sorangium sp. So ce362]|uniref:C45 family autoproteolytic acyltransferase/hydolase n=1 Tax=Sorangium sp. So ce362 TaxID=3133303 RepID=UPI003F5E51A1
MTARAGSSADAASGSAAPGSAAPGPPASGPPAGALRRPSRLARHRRKLVAAAALLAAPVLAHLGIGAATRIEPPPIRAVAGEPAAGPAGLRVLGPAYARRRGRILEARLAGSPEEIGHQHGRLFYPEMVQNEGTLHEQLRRHVPVAPLRWLLMDLSRLQFRGVDEGMSDGARREIAAQARAFSPDPFDGVLPTYHRFIFLQSLYDIALSFEHSPLIGCTSFALTGAASAGGNAVLARNFDFEAGPVFDEGKAVFLVHEQGKIPYASVSWPGLVGAVTGMNAAGLALVVHGGRAGEPRAAGEPVVHTMRDVLGRARGVDEALAILEARAPMVSHLVMLVDAAGEAAIAERAPGAPLHARRGRGKVPLTNHFEGPLAGDPRNRRVEAETSTHARRRRLDERLAALPDGATVEAAVDVLRDRRGPGGAPLPLGDRRAIDALIATHAVVMDATARVLWVSEGPHLAGRFLRFDLARLLDPTFDPALDPAEPVALPEDPLLTSGDYAAWERAGSPHTGELGSSAPGPSAGDGERGRDALK